MDIIFLSYKAMFFAALSIRHMTLCKAIEWDSLFMAPIRRRIDSSFAVWKVNGEWFSIFETFA